MIGVPGFRPVLLISALVVVAAVAVAAWQYELRPTPTQQAVAATPQRAEPRALSPEEDLRCGAVGNPEAGHGVGGGHELRRHRL